jgi:hypothetical protein
VTRASALTRLRSSACDRTSRRFTAGGFFSFECSFTVPTKGFQYEARRFLIKTGTRGISKTLHEKAAVIPGNPFGDSILRVVDKNEAARAADAARVCWSSFLLDRLLSRCGRSNILSDALLWNAHIRAL